MALVRAIRFGVDSNGAGREPGAVWDHKGALGSWMELVAPAAEPPAPPPSEPQAIEQPSTETEAAAQPPAEANGKRQLRNRKPKED